jgi:hypothetical protein
MRYYGQGGNKSRRLAVEGFALMYRKSVPRSLLIGKMIAA